MKTEIPNRHPKLSITQLQKQNEEAEAWLAKHKPHLLSSNEEVFAFAPRNAHQHQLIKINNKRAKDRMNKLFLAKAKVLKLCAEKEFISSAELAKVIGVSRPTLLRWQNLENFPKLKAFQSKFFYCSSELSDFFLNLKKQNPCKNTGAK